VALFVRPGLTPIKYAYFFFAVHLCVSNASKNNATADHKRVGTDTEQGCVICELGTELHCTAPEGLTSTNTSSIACEAWVEKTVTFYQISESNGEKVWVRHEESSEPYRRGEEVRAKLHPEKFRPVAGIRAELIWDMNDLCNTRSVRYQLSAQTHSCPPTTLHTRTLPAYSWLVHYTAWLKKHKSAAMQTRQ
jgi:hypothetical protein